MQNPTDDICDGASLLFQYCPKLVVFWRGSVLLCRRRGERDYNDVYAFIGGKMEHSDASILEGIGREKCEEVGEEFRVRVYPHYSVDTYFVKADGSRMILPHFYAEYESGEIELSEEYSEYAWVPVDNLDTFEPKVPNVSCLVSLLLRVGQIASAREFVQV